jgi:16S rRNA C967 or C1407 C5-methylase (RsmB/RsmF family)/NOL1/NOP2/fmu family ribosome biogenesis protein
LGLLIFEKKYLLSVPAALIQSLQTATGFRQESFEAVHESGEQVVSIRLNPSKKFDTAHLHISENVGWCEHGRYLKERPFFTFDPFLHAGAYYVQEASSMFLWQAILQTVPEPQGKKILDLCAAPGGKSTLLSAYFKEGLVVANEVIKNRANILVENCSKWGDSHLLVTNNDPAHFQSVPGFFDVLMIDAPCSGSGLFRKDPLAVSEWSEANVTLCCQRQQRILADALPCLAENGVLIYSTCSYSQEEDESICDWLLGEMDLESLSLKIDHSWGIVETVSPAKNAHGYRFYPDQVKGEGFFLACFQKKTSEFAAKPKIKNLQMTSQLQIQLLKDTIKLPENISFFDQNNAIRAIETQWTTALSILASHLYIKKAGIEIASLKGKDIIPSHELALSGWFKGGFPSIELDMENALSYLRRKEFKAEGLKGWNLMCFGGLPIGWAKLLPNRVNNYYPAEWRILKE